MAEFLPARAAATCRTRLRNRRRPFQFFAPAQDYQAQFSPRGTGDPGFIAYGSTQSGASEVYVAAFPDPKLGQWTISSGGGYQPRWRRDGKELLYFTGDGKLMSVEVTLGGTFQASAPKVLFEAPILDGGATANRILWDIHPDGQRFLIITAAGESTAPLTVVLNWQELLKK